MRIIVVHNTYRGPGGEDAAARLEADLLRTRGHDVCEYWRSNNELTGLRALRAPAEAFFSPKTYFEISALIRKFAPDVIHVHNWWMVVSPSVYWAAAKSRVPVVQTLQNYRLLCPNALFLREGLPCELCKTRRFASPGIRYGCYRNSHVQSLLVAATVTAQAMFGTWDKRVAKYIALTEFGRKRFIDGGLPRAKLAVKPNLVAPDPGGRNRPGQYALYAGRLSEEKGIHTLLAAWRLVSDIPLKIVGDGPLMREVRDATGQSDAIELLGWISRQELIRVLKASCFLVFPSVWYEGLPLTIIEAFACGVPVVASRLGAMAEIVQDQVTGLHARPRDSRDLAAKVQWAWDNPYLMQEMGEQARLEYLAKYAAERNYQTLLDIYEEVRAAGV